MFSIVPDNGAKIPVQLLVDGVPFNIPAATPVKAALLTRDQTALLAGPVSLSNLEAGADWSVSTVVAVFSASGLVGIDRQQKLTLEVQVEDGDPVSWFYDGEALQGHIA